MMTKEEMIQDLFNKMWHGLSAQGWRRAYSGKGGCRYRMPDGRKCAVGHCIPDDMYCDCMEGLPVAELGMIDELGWSKWPQVLQFLEIAQSAHDSPGGGLRIKFERLAAEYGLTIPGMEVAE